MKSDKLLYLLLFFSGVIFALGLGIAGMTNPAKVQNFLDVAGGKRWDATLLMVLGAATGLNLIFFRFILRRPHPLMGERFVLPTATKIDLRLVGGAALFGAGWGLVGVCPGPALASLASGLWQVFLFVGAMFAGNLLFSLLERK